jgi:hypothetical protein
VFRPVLNREQDCVYLFVTKFVVLCTTFIETIYSVRNWMSRIKMQLPIQSNVKSQSNYILVFTLLRISARVVNNEHANNLLCFYIVFFCLRIGRIDRNM